MQLIQAWGKITFLLGLVGILAGGVVKTYKTHWQSAHAANIVIDKALLIHKKFYLPVVEGLHNELLNDYDIDFRVYTYKKEGRDIDLASNEMYRQMQVGSRSRSGKGALLVIGLKQQQVRLNTSGALDSVFPAAFVSYIEKDVMAPYFRDYRYLVKGVIAAANIMIGRAQDAKAGQLFISPAVAEGEPSLFALDVKYPIRYYGLGKPRKGTAIPSEIMLHYLNLMEERNNYPGYEMYSGATRKMLADAPLSPEQMAREAINLRMCPIGVLDAQLLGTLAVVTHPVDFRQCPPYFFVREDGRWRLDLATMKDVIEFNQIGQWHFKPGYDPLSSPYRFALEKWQYDQYGFPHEK